MKLSTFFQKLFSKSNLKVVLCVLLPVLFTLLTRSHIDNDSFDMLAQGRELFNHGIYHQDALSMHEGLEIVVQNYGITILYWLAYSAFGAPSLYLYIIIASIIISILLYKINMVLTNRRQNMSLFFMLLTSFLLSFFGFMTSRPQLISYIIFLLLIYLLELYSKTKNPKCLFFIPLLSLIQINLHASLWLMLPIVTGCYIIDFLSKGQKIKPLVICLIVLCLVGLINPYGPKMISFIIGSYSDGYMHKYIQELQAFRPLEGTFPILYFAILLSIIPCFYSKRKDMQLKYLLLYFGLLPLGLNTIKGMSQFILVMFFPIITSYKTVHLDIIKLKQTTKNTLIYGGTIASVFLFAFLLIKKLPKIQNYPSRIMKDTIDILDTKVAEASQEKSDLKIYVGFNQGGYAEFRGYKPYIDPRAEVFLKTNNKKEDIFKEYYELTTGRQDKTEFLKKYDFDYVLTTGEVDFMVNSNIEETYNLIFESEESEVKLYQKSPTKTESPSNS